MIYRSIPACITVAIVALSGTGAKADVPQQVKTEKNKTLILGNFLNAPSNCATNPGPVPLPKLRERPSNGAVGLQIVMGDVAATDACPARKIPAIAIFYSPTKDFVGKDSVQIEFEAGEKKIPALSFVITVQADDRN
jgi:hypothetical protein